MTTIGRQSASAMRQGWRRAISNYAVLVRALMPEGDFIRYTLLYIDRGVYMGKYTPGAPKGINRHARMEGCFSIWPNRASGTSKCGPYHYRVKVILQRVYLGWDKLALPTNSKTGLVMLRSRLILDLPCSKSALSNNMLLCFLKQKNVKVDISTSNSPFPRVI